MSFITKKIVVKMLQLPEIGFNKLPTKPTKEKEKKKGGDYLSKNCTTKSTCQSGRLESFPSKWNVYSHIIGINPHNLVEG